ncbi:MAG: hypothetical protein ABSB82_18615 [Terriglobia bacterium]
MSDSVSIAIMQGIAENLFVNVVHNAFGDPGTAALREILAFLPQHYACAAPDLITGTLFVIRPLDADGVAKALSGGHRSETRIDRLPRRVESVTVFELLDTGAVRVWEQTSIDLTVASNSAVVYRFTPGREDFVVRDRSHAIPNPAQGYMSVFARPTFSSLADELVDYRDRLVRTSTCFLFKNAWEDHNRRLFFKPGPEDWMRKSLHSFLMIRLRDAEVLAEQNVDESHPVDVKVTWTFTLSQALVEIKWLGKSRNAEGKLVEYYDQRACDGADQLADYLNKYRTWNPIVDARGYLVVIDGRRRGLSKETTTVSREDGMYYENREIEFNPKHHVDRTDFDPPIRMFAEPLFSSEVATS